MADSTSSVSFPLKVVIPVLAVIAAVIIALIWAPIGTSERATARPGDRVLGQVEEKVDLTSGPDTAAARLPYGVVLVGWAVARTVTAGDGDHHTDGAARFVTVRWSPRPRTTYGPSVEWSSTSTDATEPVSRLVLVAAGRRYVLQDRLLAGSGPGMTTVAVADADRLSVQVESGGRRQQARAVTLVDPASARTDGRTRRVGQTRCTFQAVRSPYVRGLGLAPDGQDWLVVTGARVETIDRARRRAPVVGSWQPDEGDTDVDYVAAGRPTLFVQVSPEAKSVKARGKKRLTAAAPRLPDRVYLVPSTVLVKVSLTYRTAAEPVAGAPTPPGRPQRLLVTGSDRQSFPATELPQGGA